MTLPFFDLAFSGAIPFAFAFGAPLSGRFATCCALWVVHELLVNIGAIQLEKTAELRLWVHSTLIEKVLNLIIGDRSPVFIPHDICSQFWDHLDDERVFAGDSVVTHERHLLQSSQHVSEHGKLIQQGVIKILPKSQQVCFSKASDLVFAVSVLAEEHVVNGEPYLRLNFSNLMSFTLLDFHPSLIFELLHLALGVFPEPWLKLQKWNKSAGHVTCLHELMHDWNRQVAKMISNESD